MKPVATTKTQRRHQRRSKQRQVLRETKIVETKKVPVQAQTKVVKKSFPEIQNGQHGEWTDHPGLAYYVMDLDERFQQDFFTGRPKPRWSELRRLYYEAFRNLPEMKQVVALLQQGRKQELEPWRIHRIMGEVDMYLHGWRAKVRMNPYRLVCLDPGSLCLPARAQGRSSDQGVTRFAVTKRTWPYGWSDYGFAFWKDEYTVSVSRGDASGRKADYGLGQDDRAPPASRCVHLWFDNQEALETDPVNQSSLSSVSRVLPPHLVQAIRGLWFATTKKHVLDAICVFLREPGWKMNPDSEGRNLWDIVQESKAEDRLVSPQPVEIRRFITQSPPQQQPQPVEMQRFDTRSPQQPVTVRIGQLDVHVAPPGLVCNPEPLPVYHDTTPWSPDRGPGKTDDENDFPETKHDMSVTWIPECRHAFVSDLDMPLKQRFKACIHCGLIVDRYPDHPSQDTCTHSKRSSKYADGSRRCWECLVLYRESA